jgi:hypothetical protein
VSRTDRLTSAALPAGGPALADHDTPSTKTAVQDDTMSCRRQHGDHGAWQPRGAVRSNLASYRALQIFQEHDLELGTTGTDCADTHPA